MDDSTISRWFSGTVATPRRANLEALVAARLAEELGSEVLSAPNLESRVKAVAAWVRSRQSRASLPDEEFTEALERRARATGAGALDPAAKSGVETAIMMTTEKGGGPTEEYFSGAGGFRKEGDIWREYPALPDGDHFEFKELRRDTEHIYLYDESRKRDERSPMYLRIPIGGGMVQWSYSNPLIWQDVCVVEPGTITDTTVQSPACECVAPQTSESDRE